MRHTSISDEHVTGVARGSDFESAGACGLGRGVHNVPEASGSVLEHPRGRSCKDKSVNEGIKDQQKRMKKYIL